MIYYSRINFLEKYDLAKYDLCHKKFQSKTHLTRHKNRKNPCKPQLNNDMMKTLNDLKKLCNHPHFSSETIKLIRAYLNDKEEAIKESNLVNNLEYKCGDCEKEFAHRQSRDRHIRLNRCNKKQEI